MRGSINHRTFLGGIPVRVHPFLGAVEGGGIDGGLPYILGVSSICSARWNDFPICDASCVTWIALREDCVRT